MKIMDGINAILLCGTFCLGGIAIIALLHGREKKAAPDPPPNVAITLKELSRLWAKARETGEIRIDDLAPIWREEKKSGTKNRKSYSFKNQKIADFFNTYIDQAPCFRKAPLKKEVCYQILLLLEKEGGCPSVVNAADDVETSWDSNTYTLLGKTSLLDHTLNVALEAIKLLHKDDANHVIPDTLVAALGHDLGKIPSIKGHLYSLGEHPLAAGRVLAEISSFKQLTRKEEISRAIKLHHKRPEGLLGKTLKKADQLARQKELERAVEQLADQGIQPVQPILSSEKSSVQPGPASSSSARGSGAAWQAQADIYGEEKPLTKKKAEAPKLINISAWFDAEILLDNLRPYINRVSGRRFMAFSMANGYVYCQAKAMEEVVRKQAEQAGAMDIGTMAVDDLTMRRVLFTVVHHLRSKHEVIARELIQEQYFGGYFTITTKGGKTMKGFYTPFHAEAFGSIAVMEDKKTGLLRNFKSVEPYLKE